ncbi:undecaprenyl-phosphate glucose phosphotransferase [Phreatobacter stygius]|uniref:Undecaprenyl-phosphate glucose phosphotransferase n=1 Tax=Phreatobacter stygius TaxID=1940610 RepID=A0A4D7AQW0_9HYPH|nr:undecaprenyl-phosphate glucose phosphotransferase [Phreatobacter stygius]QCI63694.1 undecaprenyl-phosphate glucose phosphotransferase [Phreatobacter stygius]
MTLKDLDLPMGVVARRARGGYAWTRLTLMIATAAIDWMVIAGTSYMVSLVYNRFNSGDWWTIKAQVDLALLVSSLFVMLNVVRGQYQFSNYIAPNHRIGTALTLWGATFVTLMAFAFATKTSDGFSRVAVIATFVTGFPLLLLARRAAGRLMTLGSKIGMIPARRVMLVGRENDVTAFAMRYQPWNAGMHIAGTGLLADEGRAGSGRGDIARIVAQARQMYLDDVLIIVPWSETATIDSVIDAFMRMPVTIHLGPERIFDRFDEIKIAKTGGIASLQLGRPPLSAGEIMMKRMLDVGLASFALFLFTPVLLLIALAIKIDSPGPALFRQRRLGFNQRAFSIVKFRTMTVEDDGDAVRQATRGDQRITRIGRFLRRWNLDELPQLINVLGGQMSLVGPRPHAIAHDRQYDDGRIALYARRHNVKPGITGWAQVHGLRGETDTVEKMQARVEHDLYYIDNWSVLLDLEIMARTVFSRKAYDNAF